MVRTKRVNSAELKFQFSALHGLYTKETSM